jgi:hypothetical protein
LLGGLATTDPEVIKSVNSDMPFPRMEVIRKKIFSTHSGQKYIFFLSRFHSGKGYFTLTIFREMFGEGATNSVRRVGRKVKLSQDICGFIEQTLQQNAAKIT